MPERALLTLSHSASLGGAERNLLELLDALGRTAAVDRIGAVLPADGPLRAELEKRGICVFVEPVAWWIAGRRTVAAMATRWAGLIRSARAVDGVIRRFSPTMTVTNTLASPVLAMASRRRAIPHVWFVQEFVELDHDLRFLYGGRLSYSMVRHSSEVVLALSRSLAAHLGRSGVQGAETVQPSMVLFIPATPSAPIPPPLRLVLPGSIQPGKGQLDAVLALALLRERKVDVRLTLVGPVTDYAYCARLEAEGSRRGLSGEVLEIRGQVADLSMVLAAHNGVLVCSRSEAFGRVIVEAQLARRAVVVSSSGAGPELVEDAVTGLLYPPGEPIQLALAVEKLFDEELRNNLAEQAWRRASERFSSEATARSFQAAVGWPVSP